jgi:hypothetical protein
LEPHLAGDPFFEAAYDEVRADSISLPPHRQERESA